MTEDLGPANQKYTLTLQAVQSRCGKFLLIFLFLPYGYSEIITSFGTYAIMLYLKRKKNSARLGNHLWAKLAMTLL